MDPKDLLKLLDLGGKEDAPSSTEPVIMTAESFPQPSASPTALEVDEWGLRRGRDLVAESERLQALDLGDHAVADFFAAGFDPDPQLLPACVDPRRHEFLKQLLD